MAKNYLNIQKIFWTFIKGFMQYIFSISRNFSTFAGLKRTWVPIMRSETGRLDMTNILIFRTFDFDTLIISKNGENHVGPPGTEDQTERKVPVVTSLTWRCALRTEDHHGVADGRGEVEETVDRLGGDIVDRRFVQLDRRRGCRSGLRGASCHRSARVDLRRAARCWKKFRKKKSLIDFCNFL